MTDEEKLRDRLRQEELERLASIGRQHEAFEKSVSESVQRKVEEDAARSRIVDSVLTALKADRREQVAKARATFKKAFAVAAVGAYIGFFGSLVKDSAEDEG